MQLALTGERLTAQQALDLHLVSEVVDSGAALEAAVTLASRIAENAPLSLRASKRRVNAAADGATPELLLVQAELQAELPASRDVAWGIAAFRERRAPQWEGR